METLTRTRKIGESLVATIPRIIVEEQGLLPDQAVQIEVRKVRKSGFGLCRGIGPFTRADKFRGQLEE